MITEDSYLDFAKMFCLDYLILDPDFGTKGRVITDFQTGEARAIAIQRDGKIVVAGYVDTKGPTYSDFALARYNSDGSLDATFGKSGIKIIDFHGDDDKAYALAIQKDDKIVVAGEAVNMDNQSVDFALVRLNTDGSIDRTFGSNGSVLTDFNASYDRVQAIALQEDGKIVVAGFTSTFKEGQIETEDIAIARYNIDGSLDDSFGSSCDGKVTTDFDGGFDRAQAVAIQKDGKIVVAGGSTVAGSSETHFALVRYNPDGTLDPNFGDGGKVISDFGKTEEIANALVIQPDGKIVAGGYAGNSGVLAHYKADGTPDDDLGLDDTMKETAGGKARFFALALQKDGRIIAAGHISTLDSEGHQTETFALARCMVDGKLDLQFSLRSLYIDTISFDGLIDTAYAVALQKDGKIVVAGTTDTGSSKNIALARHQNPEILSEYYKLIDTSWKSPSEKHKDKEGLFFLINQKLALSYERLRSNKWFGIFSSIKS